MKKYLFTKIACPVLIVLALFFKFAMRGYSFIAYGLFGAALVIAAFAVLDALKEKYPKVTNILQKILTYGLILFLIVLAATEVVIIDSAVRAAGQESDCLIVLGAGVDGTRPSLSLKWRLDAAKEYLENYPDAVCIVSGGQGTGEDITEAECMKTWLVSAGIAEERIIEENKASTTDENIRYSFEIVEKEGFDTVSVVTADYHVCRAYLIAAANGREVSMVAADTKYPVLKTNYFFREAFAIWYYKIFGLV